MCARERGVPFWNEGICPDGRERRVPVRVGHVMAHRVLSNGTNVIPRRARPGLAGLRPHACRVVAAPADNLCGVAVCVCVCV